jgi:hypothetical protein
MKAREILEQGGLTVTIDDSPEWDVIFPGSKGSAYLDRLIKSSEEQQPPRGSRKRNT